MLGTPAIRTLTVICARRDDDRMARAVDEPLVRFFPLVSDPPTLREN